MYGVVYIDGVDGTLVSFATDDHSQFVRVVSELNFAGRQFIWWRP